MKIIYAGKNSPGETSEMRKRALERLGHKTVAVDYIRIAKSYSRSIRRIQRHLRTGPIITHYNNLIVEKVKAESFDILWVDKGIFVFPSTIMEARKNGIKFVIHYSPDNYFLRQNSSRHFWNALPFYDIVVTTKTFNYDKLKERGAKSVFLSGNAYDPSIHQPFTLTEKEYERFGCDVSFIGTWEANREIILEKVARLELKLSIWGTGWERVKSEIVRKACKMQPAYSEDYAKAICAAKINLGLLSAKAKDNITQRSVEIPACGGFLLAERTEEHLKHFSKDIEASYFSNTEEMCRKIKYYLGHEKERQRIANAGRAKCIKAGFSYDERLREILNKVGV